MLGADWLNIIHLMYGLEGNSQFCFTEGPDVSRDEVKGNIRTRGKTKLTSFLRDHTLNVLLYMFRLSYSKNKETIKDDVRATTVQLYPGRDTIEFDQGHVTKNHPITVLVLLSESLAIKQHHLLLASPSEAAAYSL